MMLFLVAKGGKFDSCVEDQVTTTYETETVSVTYYEQCQLALCCRVSLELLQRLQH